LVIKNLWMD